MDSPLLFFFFSHLSPFFFHPPTQLISPLFTVPFLSGSLAFALVYIWSRRNPTVRMSLMGIVTLRAPYLPLALVGVSWAMYNDWRSAVADGVSAKWALSAREREAE